MIPSAEITTRPARWPEAMSYETAAEYLDLPGWQDARKARRMVMRMVKLGELPAIPVGTKYRRIRRADLDHYLGLPHHE